MTSELILHRYIADLAVFCVICLRPSNPATGDWVASTFISLAPASS